MAIQAPVNPNHDSDHNQEPAKKIEATPWYKNKLVKIGGGIASLVAVGVTGVVIGGAGKNQPEGPQPSYSASEKPGPTPEVTPSQTIEPSATATATAIEATPSATTSASPETDNTELIAALEAASPKTFERFRDKERLAWVFSKLKETDDKVYFFDFLDQKTHSGESLATHSPLFTLLDQDADGQAILEQSLFMDQLVKAWKQNPSEVGNGPLDRKTARKMISGVLLLPNSDDYKSLVNAVENSDIATRFTDKVIAGTTALNTKDGVGFKLDDGELAPTKIIDRNIEGKTWRGTWAFVRMEQLDVYNTDGAVSNPGFWLGLGDEKEVTVK